VTINWGIFWTPEFLIGVVVIGLVLNVASAYVVRLLDRMGMVLPAFFRRAQQAESARIRRLADAATSDHALYAALAAEAGRLHSHQLTQFIGAFACMVMVVALLAFVKAGAVGRIGGILAAIYLTAVAFFESASWVANNRRANRLNTALREVQRNLKLPVME
jgi:pilus assembly protein TadC